MNMQSVIVRGRYPALLLCFALAACDASASDAPSADDIKAAVNDYINKVWGPWSPINNHVRVQDVKNISCAPANGKPGYMCNFDLIEIDAAKPGPIASSGAHGRLAKEGDKWVYHNKD